MAFVPYSMSNLRVHADREIERIRKGQYETDQHYNPITTRSALASEKNDGDGIRSSKRRTNTPAAVTTSTHSIVIHLSR